MDEQQLIQEADYKAVRSSGAGGQNVNKVSSKVELHFRLEETAGLSEEEKQRALKKLSSRLTNSGELILQCDESRSQHKNKEIVTQRFLELIKQAIVKPKVRKKTKTPKAAKLKRLREKKKLSEKKATRKNPLKD
ncbi:alternative ribosome rescue aminoacyl-tRNA hydrolase ArfB [Salinimicrobium sp. MT39]|uniref:Alternative ribosome rescue aminoacyl-tRNA hydrolase ArfB n=1 Tax=Salinimicrobium profundisediminis TaxID=2994553 RepID=A0A9X3I2R0_9FLAO|nr:alternative ribosome rescue aminoacyl-tRNA hydrolase ArfB [Salinimicrobium profundisediminis]MCX2839738.1 alternative ribosome rescue aminoacyl-tRNA hydrolase ArfB [Salinimicrobium profundisediminis]